MSETLTPAALVDIAVLDDDDDFRMYIEDVLRDEGYNVRAFGEPQALLCSVESRLPDIVLLDMKMGAVTGDKVAEQLLARWPDLCIIIITGYPSRNCDPLCKMRLNNSAWAAPCKTACANASAIASSCYVSNAAGP